MWVSSLGLAIANLWIVIGALAASLLYHGTRAILKPEDEEEVQIAQLLGIFHRRAVVGVPVQLRRAAADELTAADRRKLPSKRAQEWRRHR
ncbi:MAG TPA: hypothetical protein VHK70_10105 [Burkholderiaceae bacterium]|nr:hypothetical protein [Burkholderiaceae bacterium]